MAAKSLVQQQHQIRGPEVDSLEAIDETKEAIDAFSHSENHPLLVRML